MPSLSSEVDEVLRFHRRLDRQVPPFDSDDIVPPFVVVEPLSLASIVVVVVANESSDGVRIESGQGREVDPDVEQCRSHTRRFEVASMELESRERGGVVVIVVVVVSQKKKGRRVLMTHPRGTRSSVAAYEPILEPVLDRLDLPFRRRRRRREPKKK